MPTTGKPHIGVMFRCKNPPEVLYEFARQAESSGYDEVWVVEDCFFGGGIASAASTLAATSSVQVGLGIMPAVVRNPAFAAMEIATLARLYPGRFLPGIGHGVGEWMRQIGAFPGSQLAALEEVTATIRALLHGENVTVHGQHVNLDAVQLEFPPEVVPPIQLGVRGPKSLALSGRVADGTILAEFSAPVYIATARAQIAEGQQAAGRVDDHRLTVFVPISLGADGQAARDRLRPFMADVLARPRAKVQFKPLDIVPQIEALVAEVGPAQLAAAMPDAWIDLFAAAGTPEQCAEGIRRFSETGADAIVLVPMDDDVAMMAQIASDVLPLLAD